MNLWVGLLIASTAGASVAAGTYKWVDEKGVVNYGEKPPANRPASPVDTHPSAVLETGRDHQKQVEMEKRRQPGDPVSQPAQSAPTPAAAPVRGMDFDTFIRLQRGMTEGELLIRAGRPDHESVENFRRDIVKTFYYFPTVSSPFTTVVTLRGGRIFELDRVKKF
ncbi:MAG: DUF4124 domain-containing protein [Betaproteobacteria bacterium]|nr:DUF4124 domain-containing protein [Betaproteobacteria bacterium]